MLFINSLSQNSWSLNVILLLSSKNIRILTGNYFPHRTVINRSFSITKWAYFVRIFQVSYYSKFKIFASPWKRWLKIAKHLRNKTKKKNSNWKYRIYRWKRVERSRWQTCLKIMPATNADHYRMTQATARVGVDGEESRGKGARHGTMQKENTIARRNGGMHFLLVGARQRCPTALESF